MSTIKFVYLAESAIAGQLRRFDGSLLVTPLPVAELSLVDPPVALFLDREDVIQHWRTISDLAFDRLIVPIVVGVPEALLTTEDDLYLLAPRIDGLTIQAVEEQVAWYAGASNRLLNQVIQFDPAATQLTQNFVCEWIRCAMGIVGIARLRRRCVASEVQRELASIRRVSHLTVDRIPANNLRTEELWSLLLVVEVPWTQDELDQDEELSAAFAAFEADMSGTRKALLPSDKTIASLVGPFVAHAPGWSPTTDNPLKEKLDSFVKDAAERESLELLFKRKFSSEDIDALIKVLGDKL